MKFDEYERGGWSIYASFGEAVASILRSAIESDGGFRLQQVRSRAKQAASLRKKLEKRGREKGVDLLVSETLEDEIKDLCGCRVIFYTNTDVNRLIGSGLIEANFEIVERKIHHPRRDTEDATEFYISNHYVVSLRPERLGLPEYARFAGMRCEIQIQTILNHAWAEMAHDTIYKQPDLDAIGARALDAIKARMGKIARKYLLPAGHEFARVAADFERLLRGRELFDDGALDAILDASDNNERFAALESFVENVLPLYDNIETEFPVVLEAMRDVATRARETPPRPEDTPYGTLPAKTAADILTGIGELVETYRYVDVSAAFDLLLELYANAQGEGERRPIVGVARRLAEHNIHVWRVSGPAVQLMLVGRIKELDQPARRSAFSLLVEVLQAALDAEVHGTTSRSEAIVILRGRVVGSPELAAMRRDATSLLKSLYTLAKDDDERRSILSALRTAARSPMGEGYTPELAGILLESAAEFVEFVAAQASTMSWELLQSEESAVLRRARRNRKLPDDLLRNPDVVLLRDRIDAAVAVFRGTVDADAEYSIYKVLVGFGGVFPPTWENEAFDYAEEKAYRGQAIDALIEGIGPANAAAWHIRAVRCAKTESKDLATFPMFMSFLERLGERRPQVVLDWLDPLDPDLARFLTPLLEGLQKSGRGADVRRRIRDWIESGQWLPQIAWFLRYAEPFDETLLTETLERAIALAERYAVQNAIVVATERYSEQPGQLIERVLLPALAYLHAVGDSSWVTSIYRSEIFAALSEDQAGQVLDVLLRSPKVDHSIGRVLGAIAGQWPHQVLGFFGDRDVLGVSEERPEQYRATPFSIGEKLREPLSVLPELVLEAVREWRARDSRLFRYRGGQFIAAVFPEIDEALAAAFQQLLKGSREDIGFVLEVLKAYEGGEHIEALIHAAVIRLEPDDDLLESAADALDQSGVVTGEYGFVELCEHRLARMRRWQQDEDPKVRAFADGQVHYLEQRIADETRRAEASIAALRLQFGEEPSEG